MVFGELLLLFARGVAAEFHTGKAARVGSQLLTIIAICYLVSGLFVMDPSSTAPGQATVHGMLRGNRADTTINYRLRDAVLGLLTPGSFVSKGFADSGRQISPIEFASRLESEKEDYPQEAFYSPMNLLDSHDTERLLWTLTPGGETTADKQLNAAKPAEGKKHQMIAALIQITIPGSPTVFCGGEVALTGSMC